MSEANPDRERWSQDHAAPTTDAPSAPAPPSGPSESADPETTAVRRPRTKPRTGAPRAPRPAGAAPRKVSQTPVPPTTSDAAGAGAIPNPVGEDTRVTGGPTFSAGLDHLPKATPADSSAPATAPRWELPSSDPALPATPPSVLERARAGVVAAATVAEEAVAQVSSAATTTVPVPVSPDPGMALRGMKRPRRTRRARLRISRIDPWSVMKTSLLFGIAGGIIFVVATYVLMSVIEATGQTRRRSTSRPTSTPSARRASRLSSARSTS